MSAFDVETIRTRFPALATEHGGRPPAFFDGPGGTQVPDTVIDAVADYYRTSNANSGGAFATSERSDAVAHEAHVAMAEMLGASGPDEITFGANMTSLTFHISRSIGATLRPGDEIVVTTLDHQANVDPWLAMAADRDLTVRVVDILPDDVTLDLGSFDAALGPRTRLVAFGWASNAVGSINPVAELVARAHAVGAWTYVDAVHLAPHGPIDVGAVGTDFLACSAYKFFGPHAGVLYARREIRDGLPSYKVRPAHDRFATGTPNFEGLAGVVAAVDYIAWIGRTHGFKGPAGDVTPSDRARDVRAGIGAIRDSEGSLFRQLLDGLEKIRAVRIHGITDRTALDRRTPTAAITVAGVHPRAASEALGRLGIATWDGDFYATGLIERLGLAASGGVVRIGLTHYNTADEVERLLDALDSIARRAGQGDAVSR